MCLGFLRLLKRIAKCLSYECLMKEWRKRGTRRRDEVLKKEWHTIFMDRQSGEG
jgi:hypothetical protein